MGTVCSWGQYFPLAEVYMEVEGIPIHVEAAVVNTIPIGVLQNVTSEMSSLLGNWLDMDAYSMRMSQWYWLGR